MKKAPYRMLRWIVVGIAVLAVAAPVASAVPIGDGDQRYYKEHTQQELKRLVVLRAKKVKKNHSAVKPCHGQKRVISTRLGRCIVD